MPRVSHQHHKNDLNQKQNIISYTQSVKETSKANKTIIMIQHSLIIIKKIKNNNDNNI